MTAKRRQQRGRCSFCGAEGVTKEHVWAKSLIKLFASSGVIRHEYGHPEAGIESKVKRANTFAVLSRKVCRSCNSGWMREADDAARPLLAAFAKNQPIRLGPSEQKQLAFWTTKTLLALLMVEPEEFRFAGPECYRHLYETQASLPGSQVWLGANEHGDLAWARSHSLRFRDTPAQTGAFGASLSFGYAVLHFIYHGSTERQLRLRYDAHRSLKQIWPTHPQVDWPPALRMRPADLTPLAEVVNANSAWVDGAST